MYEAQNLVEMIERYRARTGRYPERVLADKIYRNRENLSYCASHNIRLSGPALGRPRKNEERDKKTGLSGSDQSSGGRTAIQLG